MRRWQVCATGSNPLKSHKFVPRKNFFFYSIQPAPLQQSASHNALTLIVSASTSEPPPRPILSTSGILKFVLTPPIYNIQTTPLCVPSRQQKLFLSHFCLAWSFSRESIPYQANVGCSSTNVNHYCIFYFREKSCTSHAVSRTRCKGQDRELPCPFSTVQTTDKSATVWTITTITCQYLRSVPSFWVR